MLSVKLKLFDVLKSDWVDTLGLMVREALSEKITFKL